ncbi:MAG: FtsQ-type POTRA domain-containing protein [Candidatus Krumholzibacteria bacterium]|nr:FtsQ-type POTRA domain-containing protein [Candidatus Krumholzibacteria bacterium]MDP7021613.1 FtsQ-type POTRA domain-containing protein [Candidatus Krumholzibacteria bacterium]
MAKPRQRMAVRRRGPWRKILLVLILCLLGLGGWGSWKGFLAILNSDFLTTRYLEVEGCRVVPEEKIRELLQPAIGQPLFRLDRETLGSSLTVLPRIRSLKLSRHLPGTLRCRVEESEALALFYDGKFREIDREGRFLERYGSEAPDLPILRKSDRISADSLMTLALPVLTALQESFFDLSREVSDLGLEERGLFFYRNEGQCRVLLGWDSFDEKIANYREIHSRLDQEKSFPEELDLRYRDQVIARDRE